MEMELSVAKGVTSSQLSATYGTLDQNKVDQMISWQYKTTALNES